VERKAWRFRGDSDGMILEHGRTINAQFLKGDQREAMRTRHRGVGKKHLLVVSTASTLNNLCSEHSPCNDLRHVE